MLAMDRISDPQVSPDGKWVAFAVRRTDLEANCGRNDLWLVSTDGTGLRRLTSHVQSDTNPRWGPDSRTIWFLSDRAGSSQVWRIALDGGEAEQITREPLDVGNLVISPDGQQIAYTMEVFPDCSTVQATKDRLDEREKSKATGRIYERLFVRHWDTWEDGRRSHLFVRPAAGGEAVDVMRDGGRYALPAIWRAGGDRVHAGQQGDCLFGQGRRPQRSLVHGFRSVPGPHRWLAAAEVPDAGERGLGHAAGLLARRQDARVPGNVPAGIRGRSVPRRAPGMAERPRTPPDARAWDRSVSSMAWSSDGKNLYAIAADTGQDSLFAIDARSGKIRTIVKDGTVHAFDVADDRIIYSLSHLRCRRNCTASSQMARL